MDCSCPGEELEPSRLDVLRQRRAKRNAGGSPDDAHERAEGVVENYLQ